MAAAFAGCCARFSMSLVARAGVLGGGRSAMQTHQFAGIAVS